jgi:large subunit ribosomal protein L19
MNQVVADLLREKYGKKNPAAIKPGDTVRVHQRIVETNEKGEQKVRAQIFEGLVIAMKHGQGLDGSFTVRKIAAGGIGVERTYPVHSPNVLKIERVKSADVSRAKLYYMRDRLGKAARFKSETRSFASWDESSLPELAEVPSDPELSETVATDKVLVEPEGTVELEALEASNQEVVPTEGQEVVAAIEAETEE